MTKKDFIKFAEMLKLCQPDDEEGRISLWNFITGATADIFAEDNANFNRERFLDACGMDKFTYERKG